MASCCKKVDISDTILLMFLLEQTLHSLITLSTRGTAAGKRAELAVVSGTAGFFSHSAYQEAEWEYNREGGADHEKEKEIGHTPRRTFHPS